MGFFQNLFGGSKSSSTTSNVSGKLQILMKQVKVGSKWTDLFATPNSTLSVDQASCYADEDGSLFFLWRDVYPSKGDQYYFSLVNFKSDGTQEFFVLKQIGQLSKGKENYSFTSDSTYSIDSDDASIQKIISFVNKTAKSNGYREAPSYIDGLG